MPISLPARNAIKALPTARPAVFLEWDGCRIRLDDGVPRRGPPPTDDRKNGPRGLPPQAAAGKANAVIASVNARFG